MYKTIKILICLFIIFSFSLFFQLSFAKYVIEETNIVAKLNIDRCKPNIELIDISTSNLVYPNYANKTHLIIGHIKIIEKNIVKNNLTKENIRILVNNNSVAVNFTNFNIVSENTNEKIYEFTFLNTLGDGDLSIEIPKGIVEDKSGSVNDKKIFSTNIIIDNLAPKGTFKEVPSSNNKSYAEVSCNEQIRGINGWNISNNTLSKEFPSYITYELPIMDLAENSSKVLIDIKNATNIMLEYGTYDAHSGQTLVTSGKITSPNTISSDSICKTEAIYMKLSGNIDSSLLQGRCYMNTYWGEGASDICNYSEIAYCHGYNPISNTNNWIDSTTRNSLYYFNKIFTQLGGIGVNVENAMALNVRKPIPSNIAKQYLYGISGIQFRLKDNSEYSIVYQAYVKGVGWLNASSDGQENLYSHTKPISGFRMSIVPKTEKQYLMDYWNNN